MLAAIAVLIGKALWLCHHCGGCEFAYNKRDWKGDHVMFQVYCLGNFACIWCFSLYLKFTIQL